MRNKTIHVTLTALLLAPLAAAAAADVTTTLWFDKPATRFQQSLPLGNGRIGAMVFGGVYEERIVLNESSVWSGSREDADRPDAHQALPEIRRLAAGRQERGGRAARQRQLHLPRPRLRPRQRSQCAVRLLPDARQPAAEIRQRERRTGRCAARAAIARGRTTRRSSSRWMATRTPNGASSTTSGPSSGKPTPVRTARLPREYRLTSAEDVPARDPRTWKLEGSADGQAWTLLDEHKDEPLFAKRHETRSVSDRQARRVPVLPLHVHAESGRHAFPGGRDSRSTASPRQARRTGYGGRVFADARSSHSPGEGRLQGRTECDSRASISSARRMKCSSRV